MVRVQLRLMIIDHGPARAQGHGPAQAHGHGPVHDGYMMMLTACVASPKTV